MDHPPILLSPPLLKVQNLTVKIDSPWCSGFILRNVSFQIRRSHTLALVGESGSGKTMTALSLLDLLPRTATWVGGEIYFKDQRFTPASPQNLHNLRGKQIAMIFQDAPSALNPVFRVGKQLQDVVKDNLGLNSKSAKNRVLTLLEQVGFPDAEMIYRLYPHQLSGGMAQRVMIAMALSCAPDLMIADEPITALDVTTQCHILSLLASLQEKLGFSLLLISHDLGMVAALADHISVMCLGEIIETSPKEELLTNPQNPYTRKLISSCGEFILLSLQENFSLQSSPSI